MTPEPDDALTQREQILVRVLVAALVQDIREQGLTASTPSDDDVHADVAESRAAEHVAHAEAACR